MRLMGLPTSNNLKNYVSYMDFGTGELSTLFGSDRVPQKVLDILDERQEIIVKKVETLDNTFYDVSKINIGDIDPFALLDKSVSLILKNAESGALRLIANDKLNVADLSSDEVFTYYTRALEIISNQEFNAGRQKTHITKSYIDSIKGNGAFREIFEFLFYGKIKGLPILNLANELKSYSHLMFPPVQDFRIHKCIAERGKYIAPPFEHQTGFRINNERPVMSFLEGILRIRLDKLSGYDPSQVVSISKNSSTSNQYRLEDVDGAYSILESIMINRMIATLKICSKRLSKSCKSYVKNAIKANITITTTKTPVADPTTQGSQSSPSDPEKKALKNILSPNSPTSVQEETLNVLQTIEDSMVLLLGDTSKGLDIQNGTLRKSTITDTPLMNILVSSITIPSKYIKKQDKINKMKQEKAEADLEAKKRDISSIMGVGRGVGILDALVFILAMLTVKESVLISMLTPRQYDNLKKEFANDKFFENFEFAEERMDIERAVTEYSYQVNAAYDLFISFLSKTS